jgi:succinyl-diaminopimelate desuccinylase
MEKEELTKLYDTIEDYRDIMVKTLGDLIKIPAINPRSGGTGEVAKANFLKELISDFGFDTIEQIDVPDDSSPDKIRPNIIAKVNGSGDSPKNIWIVVHIDIVPEGDLKLWDSDPFEPVVKEGKIIGRGTEDNGQEMVASLFAVKALYKSGIKPKNNINIALVADEELGSKFGITPLIEKGLFKEDDLIIVPDGGNPEGTMMEVSEKSIMWLRVRTVGKQTHGSLPEKGINAHKAAMKLGVKLDKELHSKYSNKDELFLPPISTFEPTKKEGNVPNINTIPGDDVFYMDCRILPDYDPEEVYTTVLEIAGSIEQETGAKFEFEKPQYDPAAPPTPPDSPIVLELKRAIEGVYKIKPYAGGIGGGTCAAIFRRAGYPAVVWSKIDDTAHSPNEYVIIDNMINDAKVYAALFAGD